MERTLSKSRRDFFFRIADTVRSGGLACLLSRAQVAVSQSPREAIAGAVHWWEKEPLRILNQVNALSLTIRIPPAELAAEKAAQSYNVEHFEATDMRGGLDDDHLFFKTKAARKQNPDWLAQYLPEAKKRGLRVIVYFDLHWYKPSFGERHPDWVQKREDGAPLSGMYNVGTNFCVNSPWRVWIFQVVRDLSAYPIDGIFYDGPIYSIDTCYCEYCRAKFQKLYGRDVPSKKLRKGPEFRDLVEFQVSSIRDFLRGSRAVIKSINPEIAFYMNGGGRQANWASARLNRGLVSEQDLLGYEGGVLRADLSRNPIWKPSVTAKLLEAQAPDKPRVVFCASKQSPWPFSVLPPPENRIMYAQTIANGANVWMGAMPPDMKTPDMQSVAEMNRFVAEHGQYFMGTRSEATTALVWSDITANYYGREGGQPGDPDAEFSGIADALLSARTPFDVIDDVSLETTRLDRYDAIFLPNVACMSVKAANGIKEYVRGGGHVFATFETSLYDETGLRRENFALADLFGVGKPRAVAGPRKWDLMQPLMPGGLLEGIAREVMPSPEYYVPAAPQGAETALMMMKALNGPYEGMPEASRDPAVVVHRFGQGEAIYSTGDLGRALRTYHMAEHLRLISNAVRRMAPSPVVIENGTRSMDITLRSQQQGRRLLLHLINFTGEMQRPIQRVIPLEDLRIRIRTKGEVKRIFTLRRPQTLSASKSGEAGVEFVLPRLEEYEVIVLEK
jgi:hypothetical protein